MEVRKEAFHARKSRATSKEEDEDEEDADEPSSISEGTLPPCKPLLKNGKRGTLRNG